MSHAAVERDLVAWGVVERGAVAMADVLLPEVRPTPRFRSLVERAVAAGHSLDGALTRALAEHPLPPEAVATRAHRAFLATLDAPRALAVKERS